METKINSVSENVENQGKFAADLEQALSVSGLGWYNLKYCLVLALFLIAVIIEPVGYSYVLPAAKCDLNISDAQRGFIASVPYIGIVITSYFWGYMVDTRGRKCTVVTSSLLAGIFAVLSGFMPEIISFTACKFLTALCIAGPAAVPYSYIGEITPLKYRDLTLSVANALQIMGSAVVPLLAWAILPLDFRINFGFYEFRPWRLLTIANAMVLVISGILMSFGPESPKYLVAQGKHDEALWTLQTIYSGNKRKHREDYPVKTLKMPVNQITSISFLGSLKAQSIPLLKPPYAKWMALNGILLFGVFATLNGLYVWVPDILNRVISGSKEGLTACDVIGQRFNETIIEGAECVDTIDRSTFIINLAANSCLAVIATAVSSTVNVIGKKALLVIVFGLVGCFCILINFITKDLIFAALLTSLPLMGLTIGPINAYAVDIFPTHLRGMAISLAMMIGRLGSVAGANVAGVLLNVECQAAFYLFGGSLIFCGLLTFLLPRSRKPLVPQQSQTQVPLEKEQTRL